MNLSHSTKVFWAVLLSLVLSNIPAVALADAATSNAGMIPTAVVINEMNKTEADQKLNEFLSRSDVQQEFMKRGISPAEAHQRVAALSEQERRQLAQQMDAARAGGDVFGILIIVLVVLMIIYFARRI
jgi:hypothetical protein